MSKTNGTSASSNGFHNGRSSNGNGNNGKKKKKNSKSKSKKSRSVAASTAAAHNDNDANAVDQRSPSPTTLNGSNGDHKRHHDDDELVPLSSSSAASRPQKKQRSKSKDSMRSHGSASLAHRLLYHCVFWLGTFITMPLLFSSMTYMSCGRAAVDPLIDFVLVQNAKGVEDTLANQMRRLKRISSSIGHVDGLAVTEDEKIQKKTRKTKSKDSNQKPIGGEEATVGEPPNIHESMCHVSSIAIGNFIHYLPHAQWLVMRNPFTATTAKDIASLEAEQEKEQTHEEASKQRKGIFQRVTKKHKQQHQEHEQPTSAAEEIDRKHPLRHILEGASIFARHRKEKKQRRREEKKKRQQQQKREQRAGSEGEEKEVDWKKWKFAMSDDYELSAGETSMVKTFAKRILDKTETYTVCPASSDDAASECKENEKQIASLSEGTPLPNRPFQERVDSVAWGGLVNKESNSWWGRKNAKDSPKKISSQSEGGRLLTAYLKIMKWPKDMYAKYPFRLCAKGCDAEISILHTLEWREKFQPWCVSPSAIKFNKEGFIYTRGHSRAGPKARLEAASDKSIDLKKVGHSMVYYRPGLASPSTDPELYSRAMVNTLEQAVSDSLLRNDGTVGRFNVVMECTGMSSKNSPSIAQVKKLFSVLQDHFPDRLGVLLAANLSGLATMMMKMVLPFVTEDVRAKIHLIPNDPEERREMLLQFMDEEEIPHYLGGKDEYEFDASGYYENSCVLDDEGILEYQTTMPYHA